jgi:hypothetical protein
MNLLKKIFSLVLIFGVAFTHSLTLFVFADNADECIVCHQKEMMIHSFEESCLACHNNDMTSLNITKSITSQTDEINTNCVECHSDKFEEVKMNEHGKPGSDCQDCHEPHPTGTNIETLSWEETIPIHESTILCETCHPVLYKSWRENSHGDSDLDCASCHDPHVEQSTIRASISMTPLLTNSILMILVIGFLIFEVLIHKVIYIS